MAEQEALARAMASLEVLTAAMTDLSRADVAANVRRIVEDSLSRTTASTGKDSSEWGPANSTLGSPPCRPKTKVNSPPRRPIQQQMDHDDASSSEMGLSSRSTFWSGVVEQQDTPSAAIPCSGQPTIEQLNAHVDPISPQRQTSSVLTAVQHPNRGPSRNVAEKLFTDAELPDIRKATLSRWDTCVRERWLGARDPLSEGEAIVVCGFTLEEPYSLCSHVNAAMDEDTPLHPRHLQTPIVDTMKCALTRLPPTRTETVYRGMAVDGTENPRLLCVYEGSTWLSGDVVCFRAFTSFSSNEKVAAHFANRENGAVLLIVHGGLFSDVSSYSAYPQEKELLAVPPSYYLIEERKDVRSQRLVEITAVPIEHKKIGELRPRVESFYHSTCRLGPPPLEIKGKSAPVPYSPSLLLRTYQLTYVVHASGTGEAMVVREASPTQIVHLLLQNDNATYALVEAAAGMGKSTMAFRMTANKVDDGVLTVLVRLPDLIGAEKSGKIPYKRDKSDGHWRRKLLRHLLKVAFSGGEQLCSDVTNLVFLADTKQTLTLHVILDGFDEACAEQSEVLEDTLMLLNDRNSNNLLLGCKVAFTVTSRPLRSTRGVILDTELAMKFSIKPWAQDTAKAYGQELLTSVSLPALIDPFRTALKAMDRESQSIPLVVDILVRKVLCPEGWDIKIPHGQDNKRFFLIQTFVKRHLRRELERSAAQQNSECRRFLDQFPQLLQAVEQVERVLRVCAFDCLEGRRIDASRDPNTSDLCWEIVKHCGLIRDTTGLQPAFLYKMLCEYFVADQWLQSFEVHHVFPQNCLDVRYAGATILFASGTRPEKQGDVIQKLVEFVVWHPTERETSIKQQFRCLVAAAVELRELKWLAEWCVDVSKRGDVCMQEMFLPALAAASAAPLEDITHSLKRLVTNKDAIPSQTFRIALDANNSTFMKAVRKRYGLDLLPSVALRFQLGPDMFNDCINRLVSQSQEKELPSADVEEEFGSAASIALQQGDRSSLQRILVTFGHSFMAKPIAIKLAPESLFPLCKGHACADVLRHHHRFPIDLHIPSVGCRGEGAQPLDMHNNGNVRVHADGGGAGSLISATQELLCPATMEGWTWQFSKLVNLTSIDTAPLRSTTSIGDEFLGNCEALRHVDLQGLANTTRLGRGFLRGAAAYAEADFTHLQRVSEIGDGFLESCLKLKELKLDGLEQVELIGNDFAHQCYGLVRVHLGALSRVRSIGDNFLRNCGTLKFIEYNAMENVTSIGDGFAEGCPNLIAVDLNGFVNVTRIGSRFLHRSGHGLELHLGAFASVTHVGGAFLHDCKCSIVDDGVPHGSVIEAAVRELGKYK